MSGGAGVGMLSCAALRGCPRSLPAATWPLARGRAPGGDAAAHRRCGAHGEPVEQDVDAGSADLDRWARAARSVPADREPDRVSREAAEEPGVDVGAKRTGSDPV